MNSKKLCSNVTLLLAGFFFLGLAPFPLHALPLRVQSNGSFGLDFTNNQEHSFTGEIYTFVNHASDHWDPALLTYNGVQNVLEVSERYHVPRIGVLARLKDPSYEFYQRGQVDVEAESQAGQTRFQFPNAKAFIISGGNLAMCLCELLRDLINSSAHPGEPLRIFLVTDAVYDDTYHWPKSLERKMKSEPRFTLAELVDATSADRAPLNGYFQQWLVGVNEPFCPVQYNFKFPDVPKDRVGFSFFIGTQPLTASDPDKALQVEFIMTPSNEFGATLQAWGAVQKTNSP